MLNNVYDVKESMGIKENNKGKSKVYLPEEVQTQEGMWALSNWDLAHVGVHVLTLAKSSSANNN